MERIDHIGFGDLKLIQQPEEFCYGIDAVILADFAANMRKRENLKENPDTLAVDLGTGTGIIPHVLSYKTDWHKLIGIDIQEASVDRAVRSSQLNSLKGRITFIKDDVLNWKSWGEWIGKADVVTCNPPYTPGGGGLTSSNRAKAIARHETTATLEDFISCAAGILRHKGSLFMVHRPSRLVDICCYGRKYGLELKELCFVKPNEGGDANIMLVNLVKGGGKQLKVLKHLTVYGEDGEYSQEVLDCYR